MDQELQRIQRASDVTRARLAIRWTLLHRAAGRRHGLKVWCPI